jgi:hypothetical protein
MPTSAETTRDFSWLAVGAVVNGFAAFGFATTATHAYGAVGSSAFVDLWTIWLGATAVLTFPTQHWLILRGNRRTPARLLALLAITTGALVLFVSFAFRESLFDSQSLVFPMLAGVLTGAAVPVGVFRGRLMVARRVPHTATILAAENVIRFVGGLVVVAAAGSVEVFSCVMLLGYVVLATYPPAWRRSRGAIIDHVGLPEAFKSVGVVGASTLVSQLVVAGGPILVAASGASRSSVTATFATLEVCGAAYVVASAMSLRFTAILAEHPGPASLRRIGMSISLTGVLIAPIIGLAAGLLGPQVVGLLFGQSSELSAASTALIAAACSLAVVGLLLLLVTFAAERSVAALLAWLAAAAIGGAVFAGLPPSFDARFPTALLVVEAVSVVGLTAIVVTDRDDG